MTRSLRMFGLAVAMAVPAVLTAQTSDRPVSVGVSGGLSVPTGDLSDGFSSGYSLAGHLYFKPASLQAVRFRADVSFDRFGGKGAAAEAADLALRNIGVSANVIYDFPMQSTSVIRPYVLGGLGFNNYKVTFNDNEGEAPDAESDLGIQVGGGLNFQLSGFTTFLEAKYVNIFADPSLSYIPITFGIRF